MASHALLHSEDDLHSAFSKQQLRHRQPFTAGEVILDDHGEKEESKPKKSVGSHRRGGSNSSDDSNGTHGSNRYLVGLIKKIRFGSQEFKEKDIHASEIAHPSGMPRSSSHGFLPGLIKKVGFGSQEFKHHGLGEQHHHHHHHSHGTRSREIFGSEDADENYREHEGLFGISDMGNQQNVERANSLFGFEDTEFETGQKGRDLFGKDDPNTPSFREKMNIVGPIDADADEIERTRHVFGDENAEDSDVEVTSEDDLKHDKKVHNGYPFSD